MKQMQNESVNLKEAPLLQTGANSRKQIDRFSIILENITIEISQQRLDNHPWCWSVVGFPKTLQSPMAHAEPQVGQLVQLSCGFPWQEFSQLTSKNRRAQVHQGVLLAFWPSICSSVVLFLDSNNQGETKQDSLQQTHGMLALQCICVQRYSSHRVIPFSAESHHASSELELFFVPCPTACNFFWTRLNALISNEVSLYSDVMFAGNLIPGVELFRANLKNLCLQSCSWLMVA